MDNVKSLTIHPKGKCSAPSEHWGFRHAKRFVPSWQGLPCTGGIYFSQLAEAAATGWNFMPQR